MTNVVFADKGALDPLADSETVVAREAEERALATILASVHDGYPDDGGGVRPTRHGQDFTTRRLCEEFAERTPSSASSTSI